MERNRVQKYVVLTGLKNCEVEECASDVIV